MNTHSEVRLRPQPPPQPGQAGTEPSRVLLHMPVDVRSASLAFIALGIGIGLLRWTQEFIVPVLLGVVLSYALTPLVDRLEARKVPRAAGAGLVLSLIVAAVGAGGYLMRGQAIALIASLPEVAEQVRQEVADATGDAGGALSSVQRAAHELQAAVDAGQPSAGPAPVAGGPGNHSSAAGAKTAPPSRIVMAAEGPSLRDYVLKCTVGLATIAGQALVVVFVALFLLASGNTFRKKMVVLAGPTLSQRRVTVQALDEVHSQIQRYLAVLIVTSMLVGLLSWLAFVAIGLNNAAAWGFAAAVANLVPYVGSIAISGTAALAGLVQFDDLGAGLLLAGWSFAVHLVVGNLVTPWLTGKSSRMSPFVVFVGVLFFGWLWGVAGLVLAFPIMATVKIVCDRVDDLKPLGQLLGA